jgi:hypothetical protein
MTPRAKHNKKEVAMKNEALKVDIKEDTVLKEERKKQTKTGKSTGCTRYLTMQEKKLSGARPKLVAGN